MKKDMEDNTVEIREGVEENWKRKGEKQYKKFTQNFTYIQRQFDFGRLTGFFHWVSSEHTEERDWTHSYSWHE